MLISHLANKRLRGLLFFLVAAALYGCEAGNKAPDFSLNNWDGKTVTMSDLKGKTVLLTFSYANCSARCPVVTVRLAELDKMMNSPAEVVYLHISIEPEMDTPQKRAQYFGLYQLDAAKDRRWMFVSGEKEELAKLWKFYAIDVEKVEEKMLPEGYYLEYTPKLVLIDKKGFIKHEADFFFEEEEIVKRVREII